MQMITLLTIKLSAVFNKPEGLPDVKANQEFITKLLHIVFATGGAIALLVITLAGLQYILSQGDPQKTAKAKNTILYAVIGLVLMMLSYTIVSFIGSKFG